MFLRAIFISAIFSMSSAARAQTDETFTTPRNRANPRAQIVTPAENERAYVGVWRIEPDTCALTLAYDNTVSGYAACSAPFDRVRAWRAPRGLRGHTALQLLDGEGDRVWSGLRVTGGAIVGGPRSARVRLVRDDAGFDRNPPPH